MKNPGIVVRKKLKLTKGFISTFKRIISDKNGSYISWELCYNYFGRKKINNEKAALYLYQYLAAFGMLRASAPLFKKNYLVLRSLIPVLKKYKNLRGIPINGIQQYKNDIEQLTIEIEDKLTLVINTPRTRKKIRPTETLISKILLGVLACTPAFDTRVNRALKKLSLSHDLENIAGGFDNVFINRIRAKFSLSPVKYPDMRIIDMYLWYRGKK